MHDDGDISKETKAKQWEQSESTFAALAARRHIPLRGTFELTARCNFQCKMCYIHMTPSEITACNKKELTAKQWIGIAEDAIKHGTVNLMITGGEPLIREDFIEIYTEISKMGFIIGLNTNASLIDERYYKLFSKYPPTSVSVTLYGADADVYRKITGNAENYDKTIKGLTALAELPTEIEIKTTFIKENKDQLDKLRETANRFTKRFAINYMVFKPIPGVVSKAEHCRLSAKECYDIHISNKEYYDRINKDKKPADQETAKDESFDGVEKNDPKKRDTGVDEFPQILTCLSAKAAYWIAWDGRMLPCGTFAAIYTEPLKEGFKEAWDRLPELFLGVNHPQKCLDCELYDMCPNCLAYFEMETGSYDIVPEYICELTREKSRRLHLL